MKHRIFKFDHICEQMPENVHFFQMPDEETSMFEIRRFDKDHKFLSSAVVYGFRYCPYCGKSVDELEEQQ